MRPVRPLDIVLSVAFAAGCALTQKAEPLRVTYYTVERDRDGVTSQQAPSGSALRLGRVASGTDLGERIVFGDGEYRVGYYDSRRWTQRPEVYVRRSLARALFEESGFRRVLVGDAPTLDLEVLAFDEVKTPTRHEACVALRIVLSTDHVLLEDTVALREPVAGDRFDDVVSAIARALDRTADEVTKRVGSALRGP